MEGRFAEAWRNGKMKSPMASPFRPIEKISIPASSLRVSVAVERDVATPTSSTPSVEKRFECTVPRRLSSENILASPSKSALKKSNDRSSSPAKFAERKPSLISVDRNDNKELNTTRPSLPYSILRANSPPRKQPNQAVSPVRDINHVIRSSGLIVAPQVSPLKLAVKTKSSGTLGLNTTSTSRSPKNLNPVSEKSSPRRRSLSLEDPQAPMLERSLFYQCAIEETSEGELEWDHLTKSFVSSPRK